MHKIADAKMGEAIVSNLQNKELKRSREVQQAFRSFLGEIFMDVSLMPAEYCRHLQVDLPPALQLPLSLGQGDQQPDRTTYFQVRVYMQ